MGIKKYFASQDNTITNAYKNNLVLRGTGSNMGAADILETFVIHGQTNAPISASNAEQCRFLIQFPVSNISADMTAGALPNDSGSIKFYLNLYNAPHGNTTPLSYSLDVCMASQPWNEGRGLDMNNYTDLGASNWVSASVGTAWTSAGGSILTGSGTSGSVFFETGLENLRLDVSEQVYKWLNGTTNAGFLIKYPDSVVSGSTTMYTKMFFARTSEYYDYRPTIEAWWDSTRRDNRGDFAISSSLAPASENLNTLYMYNVIRGHLQNIPNLSSDTLNVEIYSGSTTPVGDPLTIVSADGSSGTSVTAGLLVENNITATGIYTASFASTSSYSPVFDVWSTGSGGSRVEFFTSSYTPKEVATSELLYNQKYVTSMPNLEASYVKGQKPTLMVFARQKNWSPNIYTKATSKIVPEIIENAYYRVFRMVDDLDIIPYGTGSAANNYSRLSYDVSGNYFELDTNEIESGFAYGIKFAYYLQGTYQEQPEVFKIRIEEDK